MSVRVQRVEAVKIHVREKPGFSWASVRFEESTGFVSITGDYGDWSYYWPPRHRASSLGHFLSQLGKGYAGGKMLGAGLKVFDAEKTTKYVREYIVPGLLLLCLLALEDILKELRKLNTSGRRP